MLEKCSLFPCYCSLWASRPWPAIGKPQMNKTPRDVGAYVSSFRASINEKVSRFTQEPSNGHYPGQAPSAGPKLSATTWQGLTPSILQGDNEDFQRHFLN